MNSIVLGLLEPLLKPIARALYENLILPELQKLDGQIPNPMVKQFADKMLADVNVAVESAINAL